MKYIVPVCRTSYAFRDIEVEANSENEAEEKALAVAGNFEYSEKDAEYSIPASIAIISEDPSISTPYKRALLEYGPRVIREAESYYETMDDKDFWQHLTDEERNEYLARAKYNLAFGK